jgi:hypothetical protein
MFRTGGTDCQAGAVIVNGTNGNEPLCVAADAAEGRLFQPRCRESAD